jgi:hypothetical protein
MLNTMSLIKKEYEAGDINSVSALRALNDIGYSVNGAMGVMLDWKKHSFASSYLTKKASNERLAAMRQRVANEITNSCSSGDFWKLPLSEQRAVVQLALNNS